MKKVFFMMSLVLLTLSSFSQSVSQELTGAVGLTFVSDKSTVKSILSLKGTYQEMNDSNSLVFVNISVGSKKADMVICEFIDNKLFQITCYFSPEIRSNSKARELYNDFTSILTTKYGKAASSFRIWYLSISSNKSYWFVPDKATGNSIKLSIEKDLTIHIEYKSKALMTIAIKKQKFKDTNEF